MRPDRGESPDLLDVVGLMWAVSICVAYLAMFVAHFMGVPM